MGDLLKYRIPGKDVVTKTGSFFALDEVENYQGFFLTNFDQSRKYGFTDMTVEGERHYNTKVPFTIYHDDYIAAAEKVIKVMERGECKKIVLSRVAKFPLQTELEEVFNKLIANYPKAFVYLISSRSLGTWMGASPEVLLKQENDGYEIASLAGTKLADDATPWGHKEIIEQQLVTTFIKEKLTQLGIENFQVSSTKDAIAGPVKHLKTIFSISGAIDVPKLIAEIHPTPAVCGLPRDKALQQIKQTEQHQRDLYTGVIGVLGEETSLFVNLRCMQCFQDSAYLYLGGGLTALSIPEKEWEETKNKAKTLLRVIQ